MSPLARTPVSAPVSALLRTPVKVALVNDHPIVLKGLSALLGEYPEAVRVVSDRLGAAGSEAVDVILFDTFANDDRLIALERLVRGNRAKVILFTWSAPDVASLALARGAAGYLFKGASAKEIVRAVQAVHEGRIVVGASAASNAVTPGDWPGERARLTQREAEVLSFIAQGLTNKEISESLFLSINSVKTYIRTAYAKIGVSRRSQAVSWALQHELTRR